MNFFQALSLLTELVGLARLLHLLLGRLLIGLVHMMVRAKHVSGTIRKTYGTMNIAAHYTSVHFERGHRCFKQLKVFELVSS